MMPKLVPAVGPAPGRSRFQDPTYYSKAMLPNLWRE